MLLGFRSEQGFCLELGRANSLITLCSSPKNRSEAEFNSDGLNCLVKDIPVLPNIQAGVWAQAAALSSQW